MAYIIFVSIYEAHKRGFFEKRKEKNIIDINNIVYIYLYILSDDKHVSDQEGLETKNLCLHI